MLTEFITYGDASGNYARISAQVAILMPQALLCPLFLLIDLPS